MLLYFFFQAEDGIRDIGVTGVQTCALPIYKVRYYNVMKLFEELTMARIESRLPKLFERLSQYDLLILDDFAIKKLTTEQVIDLMEIIEDRHGNKSTIFASQLRSEERRVGK